MQFGHELNVTSPLTSNLSRMFDLRGITLNLEFQIVFHTNKGYTHTKLKTRCIAKKTRVIMENEKHTPSENKGY